VIAVDQIIDYENGDLDDQGMLILFGQLIASGQAWTLQGHYGRTAENLINAGLIGQDGAVDWDEAEAQGVERPVQLDSVLQAGVDSGHVVIFQVPGDRS
jgi:hypothetical protein